MRSIVETLRPLAVVSELLTSLAASLRKRHGVTEVLRRVDLHTTFGGFDAESDEELGLATRYASDEGFLEDLGGAARQLAERPSPYR